MSKQVTLSFFLTVLFSFTVFAQSTYQQVYNIFQAKCSGCHNQSINSGQLNLQAAMGTVHAALVNKNPVNPAAISRGDKRITPGDPHRSYLLRKINNGLDADNGITAQEGTAMPPAPNNPLSNYEIELVRQWILAGAPQNGTVVDTSLVQEYYTKGGINSVPTPLAPPAAGTGFQVHLGKIFVPRSTEAEFFLKYNPKLADTTEVKRVTLAQAPQSHHFVIYKFFPGQSVSYPEGLRGTDKASHGGADGLCAFAPQQTDHTLPPNTAYLMEKSTVLDLNLHIVNSSPDSVLAAEIYFNMYTQPKGTAQKYMYRRNFPELGIVIPPGDTTFTALAYDSSETNMWDIWILYTHTHRFGTDYDVWERNPDGSSGKQVYEGWMDWTYTFNQGYYGWGIHAPQEHFENPFLEINPHQGLIHKAKYYNTDTATVYFGLTSLDEMMVMGFEYTYGSPIPQSGVKELYNHPDIKIYPNPSAGRITIEKNAGRTISFCDLLGNLVHSKSLESNRETLHLNLPEGLYFYEVSDEKGRYGTGKIVVMAD